MDEQVKLLLKSDLFETYKRKNNNAIAVADILFATLADVLS